MRLMNRDFRLGFLLCVLLALCLVPGCGSSGGVATGFHGDPSAILFGGSIATDTGRTASLSGTNATLPLVHADETVHITAVVDPGVKVVFASISSVSPQSPVIWFPMNAVAGSPGTWTLDFTLKSAMTAGLFAVSAQVRAANGDVVSGPVGVFYYSKS